MEKKQIAHDIAIAFLPIAYQQHIAAGKAPENFDALGEYKRMRNAVEEDPQI